MFVYIVYADAEPIRALTGCPARKLCSFWYCRVQFIALGCVPVFQKFLKTTRHADLSGELCMRYKVRRAGLWYGLGEGLVGLRTSLRT
jgi:hypothetical protein